MSHKPTDHTATNRALAQQAINTAEKIKIIVQSARAQAATQKARDVLAHSSHNDRADKNNITREDE